MNVSVSVHFISHCLPTLSQRSIQCCGDHVSIPPAYLLFLPRQSHVASLILDTEMGDSKLQWLLEHLPWLFLLDGATANILFHPKSDCFHPLPDGCSYFLSSLSYLMISPSTSSSTLSLRNLKAYSCLSFHCPPFLSMPSLLG